MGKILTNIRIINNSVSSNTRTLFLMPTLFFSKFYNYFFINKLLKIEKDCSIIIKGNIFCFPNANVPYAVLEEVFAEEVYKNLKGLDLVLDFGSYLGDSSVYLAMHNKRVISYEAHPKNYVYVKKNLKGLNNVKCYNKAVVASNKKQISFYNSQDYDWGGNTRKLFNKNKKITVETEHISKILKENKNADGLKMDIEGSEFEVLEYFIRHQEVFNFRKGYIEFHFSGKNKENFLIFKKFISMLNSKKYAYTFRSSKYLSLKELEKEYESLSEKDWFGFHTYFTKKPVKKMSAI